MIEVKRPRFSTFRMPGWPMIIGFLAFPAFTVLGAVLSETMPLGSLGANMIFLAGLGLGLVFFWVLVRLDKERYRNKLGLRLSEFGFSFGGEPVDELLIARPVPLRWMLPQPLLGKQIYRWGELDGAERATIVGAAEMVPVAARRIEITWVFVALRLDFEIPMFAIGRKKLIIPKGMTKVPIQNRKFAKKRTLWTEAEGETIDRLQLIIEGNAEIFTPPKDSAISLRMGEEPGKYEQWIAADGWLVYADRGRLNPSPMIEAVELVTQVADQLRAAAEILNPKPENEQAAT